MSEQNNIFDPCEYAITIKLVDQEYMATVAELPDLIEYSVNQNEAYWQIIDSISMLRRAAIEQNRPFPAPNKNNSKCISINRDVLNRVVEQADVLLTNWPANRDGMDEPLPVGVKGLRLSISALRAAIETERLD